MPRYYFDVQDGSERFIDDVGSELPDFEAARQEAADTISNWASRRIAAGGTSYFASITVRHSGQIVIKMHLAFDTTLSNKQPPAELL